jgi:hypothetical protein
MAAQGRGAGVVSYRFWQVSLKGGRPELAATFFLPSFGIAIRGLSSQQEPGPNISSPIFSSESQSVRPNIDDVILDRSPVSSIAFTPVFTIRSP